MPEGIIKNIRPYKQNNFKIAVGYRVVKYI